MAVPYRGKKYSIDAYCAAGRIARWSGSNLARGTRKTCVIVVGFRLHLDSRYGGRDLPFSADALADPFAHSPQDEIVPFAQGQALYATAPEPKQFLELQGGHNNGFIYMREEWVSALGDFMRRNL